MKVFFKTRELARQSKIVKNGKGKVKDCGTDQPVGRRWSVDVPLNPRGNFFKK